MIFLTEFSPYIFENFILNVFPFLEVHSGRGIFYTMYSSLLIMASLGSFCLDPDMGEVMKYSGIVLMFCGILYVISFFILNRGYEYSSVSK